MYHHFVEVNGILAFNSRNRLDCYKFIDDCTSWDDEVIIITRPAFEVTETLI